MYLLMFYPFKLCNISFLYRSIFEDEMNAMKIKMSLLEAENEVLNARCNALKEENLRLTNKCDQYTTILNSQFTSGQIKRLLHPSKCSHWDSADIATAISLHGVGPKAYRFLRKTGYPLQTLSTLRKWALNMSVSAGILAMF